MEVRGVFGVGYGMVGVEEGGDGVLKCRGFFLGFSLGFGLWV